MAEINFSGIRNAAGKKCLDLCFHQKYHSLMFSERKSKCHRDFDACNHDLVQPLTTCLRGIFHKTSSHIFFQKQMKENVAVPFYRRK